MPDEDQVDLVVVPRQEQVQQDEEALRELLARLVHRARDVHQAEHDRLGGRHRDADPVAVAQVDRVEVRNAHQAGAQRGDAQLQLMALDVLGRIERRLVQRDKLALELAELRPRAGADRDATTDRAAHRTQHAQIGRRARIREAGAVALHLRRLGELRAGQARQRQVVEEDLHELFFGQVEDEVVLALARIAGLALTAAAARATLRPLDLVAAQVLLVARMHHLARAALAVAERRLADVAPRQVDVLALLDVADAATVDGTPHRVAQLLLVAAQEPFAVADGLVLARQTPIDDLLKHCQFLERIAPVISCSCAPSDTTRTTGAPASRCSPSRPCGSRSSRASSPRRRWPWR